MMTAYAETFEDKDFDEKNIAHVIVNSPTPSFGVCVLDHPGFVLADTKGSTIKIVQKSLDT